MVRETTLPHEDQHHVLLVVIQLGGMGNFAAPRFMQHWKKFWTALEANQDKCFISDASKRIATRNFVSRLIWREFDKKTRKKVVLDWGPNKHYVELLECLGLKDESIQTQTVRVVEANPARNRRYSTVAATDADVPQQQVPPPRVPDLQQGQRPSRHRNANRQTANPGTPNRRASIRPSLVGTPSRRASTPGNEPSPVNTPEHGYDLSPSLGRDDPSVHTFQAKSPIVRLRQQTRELSLIHI